MNLTLRVHRTRPRGWLLNHKQQQHQIRSFCPVLALAELDISPPRTHQPHQRAVTWLPSAWPAVPTAEWTTKNREGRPPPSPKLQENQEDQRQQLAPPPAPWPCSREETVPGPLDSLFPAVTPKAMNMEPLGFLDLSQERSLRQKST